MEAGTSYDRDKSKLLNDRKTQYRYVMGSLKGVQTLRMLDTSDPTQDISALLPLDISAPPSKYETLRRQCQSVFLGHFGTSNTSYTEVYRERQWSLY